MSYNQVLARKTLGSVTVAGRAMVLSAATKTSLWNRPEDIVETLKEPLEKAVETNQNVIPAETAEICTREPNHTSESDSRSHITAVCFDKNGKVIKSVHLATPRK